MALEVEKINRSNTDRDNRQLKKEQEKLVAFMEVSRFREYLETFRGQNRGWPKIASLSQYLPHLTQWRAAGINIFCLLEEE